MKKLSLFIDGDLPSKKMNDWVLQEAKAYDILKYNSVPNNTQQGQLS